MAKKTDRTEKRDEDATRRITHVDEHGPVTPEDAAAAEAQGISVILLRRRRNLGLNDDGTKA